MVAGGGFEPPTFGLCDLTHLSMRVGLYLHPRGMLAIPVSTPSPTGLSSNRVMIKCFNCELLPFANSVSKFIGPLQCGNAESRLARVEICNSQFLVGCGEFRVDFNGALHVGNNARISLRASNCHAHAKCVESIEGCSRYLIERLVEFLNARQRLPQSSPQSAGRSIDCT